MRAVAACVLGCLAVAGCGWGGDEEERPAAAAGTGGEPAITLPPDGTPQPLTYADGARAALEGGAVAVVDATNRVAVAPRRMDVNREQTLSGLRWLGWGTRRTIGRGDVSTLICDPNCATGTRESSRATIVLSAPRDCRGGRFYTRSSMTYVEPDTGKTRAPSTYLRTPPC